MRHRVFSESRLYWGRPLASVAVWLTLGCGEATRNGHVDDGNPADAGTTSTASNAGQSSGGGSALGGASGAGAKTGSGATASANAGAAGVAIVGPDQACTDQVPSSSQFLRLTREQYDRTIRDLLGVTSVASGPLRPPSALLTEIKPTQTVTFEDVSGYQAAAEAVASWVKTYPDLRSNFITCDPVAQASCWHDTIVTFGRRAFRRPLTAKEVERFEKLVASGAEITETGAPEEIVEVLLIAFLVSPSFLQRTELQGTPDANGAITLSSYEVASRLSYLLWGSMPDPELDRAADADALKTPEQVRAQAQRMLRDPKAHEGVAAFHRAHLGLEAPDGLWTIGEKNATLYPTFKAASTPKMLEETERFFETVVFRDRGGFADLFTSPVAFVNADTAPLYDLDPAEYGAELVEVKLDPQERPGFLTRVGFLSATAGSSFTSPSTRGYFIQNNILGVYVPPESIAMKGVERAPGAETTRQSMEKLTARGECSGCHQYVDPLGFVLEGYDAVGRARPKDVESGAAIDTQADVLLEANGATVNVKNPAELMQRLATSESARRVYARRWLSSLPEHDPVQGMPCAVERLSEKMAEPGYTLLDLITDVTLTEPFRIRTKATR